MVGKSASLARLGKIFARFRRERRAAVSPILALALIPIIFTMGFATELSSWWLMQRSLQHAADSAAIVAATDAGNYPNNTTCGSAQGYQCAAPSSPVNCNQATTDPQHSWYCQAIATAAKYGYVNGVNTVVVTPQAGLCSNFGVNLSSGFTNSWCFKVTVQKDLPVFLLGIMGYRGTTTIAGINYQQIGAHSLASVPGPQVDFCILTTAGDFHTTGAPSANLQKCSVFANGNADCAGHSLNIYADYASNNASCPSPDINGPDQNPMCDPYGATSQTFPYSDGAPGSFTVSCPNSTNLSSRVPAAPAGCTALNANTLAATNGSFPVANVISQTTINNAATTGLIQICGNASLGSGTVTASGKNAGVNGCGSTLSFPASGTPTTNLEIIVYNGSLNFNGCTLQNNEPTALDANGNSYGGMSVILAPISGTTSCASPITACSLLDTNSNPGTLDIAAPLAGTFKGVAVMQSANYAAGAGCGGGNSGNGGPGDWCNAGNSPTLAIQGLIYMPNASIEWSGAVSKFQQPGALNCLGMIVKSVLVHGTNWSLNNYGTASITGQCTAAGVVLPGVPGTHTYYQALVG